MTSPHLTPELYDAYTLAGKRSPGVVTFSGLSAATKWETKEAKGQDGASTTRQGKKLAQFTATHYLVHDPYDASNDDFAAWEAFLPLLKSTAGGADPIALDFYHPEAARLDIRSVVVEEIGALEPDGKGGATVKVKFLEYAPPKPKTSTGPSGSKTSTNKAPNAPDPNAAAKAELAALLAAAKDPNT